MGLYAQLVIQRPDKMDSAEIKNLQDNIVYRFGESLFPSVDFINEVDDEYYKISQLDKYVYWIALDSKYYHESNPQGDGLRISSLIIYLTREGYNVLYGADLNLCKYTESDGVRLFNYFLKYGNSDIFPEGYDYKSENIHSDFVKYLVARLALIPVNINN